eukprot:361160-Chlamydomonas_euryale.AAC.6
MQLLVRPAPSVGERPTLVSALARFGHLLCLARTLCKAWRQCKCHVGPWSTPTNTAPTRNEITP